MARPKAFDTDSALDNAMNTFWSKGFMATTVQDLVDSTGLGRGSLYNAFSSKEQLFLDALRRYDSVWTARQEAVLSGAGSLHDRVSTLLMSVVDEETAPEPARGCLAVNAALELANNDPAVRDLVRSVFERMENALHEAIRLARTTGEVTSNDDPRGLALYILNSMYGLRVLGKTASRESLAEVVEMVMRAL